MPILCRVGQRLDRAGVRMGADMKIESGKYYRTRDGDVAGPMRRVDWCDATFTAGDFTWNEDGSYVWIASGGQGIPYKMDLISEVYVSDTPPADTPAFIHPALGGPSGPFLMVPEAKTLRDEFAMEAMKLLLAKHDWVEGILALYSYKQADAMMEARKK